MVVLFQIIISAVAMLAIVQSPACAQTALTPEQARLEIILKEPDARPMVNEQVLATLKVTTR
jgi:hypothetical protein